jgi:hypothetical protein
MPTCMYKNLMYILYITYIIYTCRHTHILHVCIHIHVCIKILCIYTCRHMCIQVWLKSLQAFQSYAGTYTHTYSYIHAHTHLFLYIYIYIDDMIGRQQLQIGRKINSLRCNGYSVYRIKLFH